MVPELRLLVRTGTFEGLCQGIWPLGWWPTLDTSWECCSVLSACPTRGDGACLREKSWLCLAECSTQEMSFTAGGPQLFLALLDSQGCLPQTAACGPGPVGSGVRG